MQWCSAGLFIKLAGCIWDGDKANARWKFHVSVCIWHQCFDKFLPFNSKPVLFSTSKGLHYQTLETLVVKIKNAKVKYGNFHHQSLQTLSVKLNFHHWTTAQLGNWNLRCSACNPLGILWVCSWSNCYSMKNKLNNVDVFFLARRDILDEESSKCLQLKSWLKASTH